MSFYGKSMHRAFFRNVIWYPYKNNLSQFNFRNRKANIHKWFECNGYVIAIDFGTLNCRHELPMH
jgi:hypothetical protein